MCPVQMDAIFTRSYLRRGLLVIVTVSALIVAVIVLSKTSDARALGPIVHAGYYKSTSSQSTSEETHDASVSLSPNHKASDN